DMTLFEVDEAATRIREEVDPEAMIILGATFDDALEGLIRVSVVATGIDFAARAALADTSENRMADLAERLKTIRAGAAAPAPAPVVVAEAPRPVPTRP